MTVKSKASLLGLVAIFTLGGLAGAVGISVEPSYVRVVDVKMEQTTRLQKEIGYLLKITNRDAAPAVYTVSVLACRELNMKPNGGYEEFPDMKWFVFRSTEITVAAQGTGYLPYLELKAPKGQKYLNKKWQVLLKVARQGKEFIGAEAILPLWIETKTEKRSEKRSGEIKHGK